MYDQKLIDVLSPSFGITRMGAHVVETDFQAKVTKCRKCGIALEPWNDFSWAMEKSLPKRCEAVKDSI